MKRNIKLIYFFFLMQITLLSSQFNIGLKLGINYCGIDSRLVPEDGTEYLNLLTYVADGLAINYSYNSLKINSGIFYSIRGANFKLASFGDNFFPTHFSFFEIPIIISKTVLTKNLYCGIGVVNSFRDAIPIHLIGDKDYELDLKALIEWNFNKKLSLDISYLYGGVNSLFSRRETYLYSVFNISAAYYFFNYPKSKKLESEE